MPPVHVVLVVEATCQSCLYRQLINVHMSAHTVGTVSSSAPRQAPGSHALDTAVATNAYTLANAICKTCIALHELCKDPLLLLL